MPKVEIHVHTYMYIVRSVWKHSRPVEQVRNLIFHLMLKLRFCYCCCCYQTLMLWWHHKNTLLTLP